MIKDRVLKGLTLKDTIQKADEICVKAIEVLVGIKKLDMVNEDAFDKYECIIDNMVDNNALVDLANDFAIDSDNDKVDDEIVFYCNLIRKLSHVVSSMLKKMREGN